MTTRPFPMRAGPTVGQTRSALGASRPGPRTSTRRRCSGPNRARTIGSWSPQGSRGTSPSVLWSKVRVHASRRADQQASNRVSTYKTNCLPPAMQFGEPPPGAARKAPRSVRPPTFRSTTPPAAWAHSSSSWSSPSPRRTGGSPIGAIWTPWQPSKFVTGRKGSRPVRVTRPTGLEPS